MLEKILAIIISLKNENRTLNKKSKKASKKKPSPRNILIITILLLKTIILIIARVEITPRFILKNL
jgi:hypothetical protein